MYYSVYWTAKTNKKVVGQDVQLYQLTDPETIKGNSKTKILVPQGTTKRDRVVIMAKNKADLASTLSKDATDSNNIVIPVDNGQGNRVQDESDAYNTVKEVNLTERDEEKLNHIRHKVVKQKDDIATVEDKIQASGDKYKKEQAAPQQARTTPVEEASK